MTPSLIVDLIAGALFLGLIGLLLFKKPKGAAREVPCPGCGGPLANRGFVSWNGGAGGDLNLLTTGIAAPGEPFVERLRAQARDAPAPSTPGGSVRMVGDLTLYECPGCATRYLDESRAGLRACPDESWSELTAGSRPGP